MAKLGGLFFRDKITVNTYDAKGFIWWTSVESHYILTLPKMVLWRVNKMSVSLSDPLDMRAILISTHFGPKLYSNKLRLHKKILNTQKLYNYTFFTDSQWPRSLLWVATSPVLSLYFSDLRLEKKCSRFESGCYLCVEVSSLQ